MFSVYDPLALTIRDSWSFIGNSGGSYREEQGLSGPKHRKYGNCGGRISESVRQQACFWGMTSKTPGNDVWVTSYMKENRSEAEIRKSENDKEEMS